MLLNCRVRAFLASIVVMFLPDVCTAQQPVNVGYSPSQPPINFMPGATPDNLQTIDPEGKLAQGAMIDVMNAIASDLHIQVHYIALLPSEGIPAFGSKRIDVDVIRQATPGRQGAAQFSQPIFTTSDGLLVKKTDETPYETWKDLKAQVIGVQKGTSLDGPLQKSGLFADVKVYATPEEVHRAVISGVVKAEFNSNAMPITYALKQGQLPELRQVQTYKPTYHAQNAMMVRSDESDLLTKINASLTKLKANGRARAIFSKFGVEDSLIQ